MGNEPAERTSTAQYTSLSVDASNIQTVLSQAYSVDRPIYSIL